MARQCIAVAERIWEKEIHAEPVFYRNVGVPNDLDEEKTVAAVELYLATGKEKYLEFIQDHSSYIMENIDKVGWAVGRVSSELDNKKFLKRFDEKLKVYNQLMQETLSRNPYGVRLDPQVWGYGWNIIWSMYKHYYLIKNYPGIFSIDPLLDCNEFQLGKHPYSNVSYVSGVGTGIPIPAFGPNRSHYSYVPGGHFSGVNLIQPDFPELLEGFPFSWQQSEYIIHAGSAYMFTILAADKLLNGE